MNIIEKTCPICKKHKIKVYHRPKCYGEHKAMAGSNKKRIPTLYNEVFEVIENCKCGAKKKDINTKFKGGKPMSNENVIKRMKDLGISCLK